MDFKKLPDVNNSATSTTSTTPARSLECSPWCKGAVDQLDDILNKSHVKSEDILVTLASQQGLLSGSSLSVQQSEQQIEQSVHEVAQLLACQGLLTLRITKSAFAQREYALFLNYMNTAMLHLGEAIRKSKQNE